ncbi:MAG: hypothetical protein WCG25_09190 [bacterium]
MAIALVQNILFSLLILPFLFVVQDFSYHSTFIHHTSSSEESIFKPGQLFQFSTNVISLYQSSVNKASSSKIIDAEASISALLFNQVLVF